MCIMCVLCVLVLTNKIQANNQTNDNIHMLRNIVERTVDRRRELYLLFIDLRVALDTANKSIIWKCFKQLQVPSKLTIRTKSIYKKLCEIVICHQLSFK